MKFYKDRFDKWHKEEDFLKMAQIFCPAFPNDVFLLPDYLKDSGCIHEEIEITNPSVVDYLKMGMRVDAISCYYHAHNGCTLKEARDMVEKIEKDMEAIKNEKI